MAEFVIEPRVLNRWLDIIPVIVLERVRSYITIPTFSIEYSYLGYSDIVGVFNCASPNNITLRATDIVENPNYLLCVSYVNDDGDMIRYKLWDNVGEVLYFEIPLYTGQLIQKDFRFEIWSIGPQSLPILEFNLNGAGSAIVNQTWNYDSATQYEPDTGTNTLTYIGGDDTWFLYNSFAVVQYSLPPANFPFGIWVVGSAAAPAPFTSIDQIASNSAAYNIYTSLRGNIDTMNGVNYSLLNPSSLVTDFNILAITNPWTVPADSAPTPN